MVCGRSTSSRRLPLSLPPSDPPLARAQLSETERARLNLSLFKSIASMYAMLLQCEGDGKEKDPTSSHSVRVELSRADALLELVGSAPQSAKTNR